MRLRACLGAKRKLDLKGLTNHITLNLEARLKNLAKKFKVKYIRHILLA
jgi:hypothetical protein